MGKIFGHVDVDNNWVPALSFPMHLGLCEPHTSEAKSLEPCSFTKFQNAPDADSLTSFGSMRKDLRHVCLGEAKSSHSRKTWAGVCFSAPHLPHSAIFQPHYVKTSSHRVMSYKEADINPGLCLITGQ